MKTKVTTREYDAKGRLVKETIQEYDYERPIGGIAYPSMCVCWQPWSSTIGRTCPVHGYISPPTIWCTAPGLSGITYNTNTTATPDVNSIDAYQLATMRANDGADAAEYLPAREALGLAED